MSKLKKGQNITKTAEEISVELNGEMSMDAKLIREFITYQAPVAMDEKKKQHEKKTKKLEKGIRDRVSGESTKKTVEGEVDAPPRKRKHLRINQTPSQDHPRNLCLDWHKAERASFEANKEDDLNMQALPTAVRLKKGKRRSNAV